MISATHNYLYQNALMGLMTGHLMPWDKDILSDSPLPSTVIEPYMAKEVTDVRDSMRMTYETMVVWIDEAKKVNYFSKRFVQLSKMIMNGVTSMGRGLITLHARGEALDNTPMSIQDLIGVASYHFRKSHLGVLQTVRSHPEISERLLMNQIGWNNMLMRLFKTREKLESGARIQEPRAREDQSARIEELKDNDSNLLLSGEKELLLSDGKNDGFDPFKLFGSTDCGLSEPAAIREPGAFTAPRAFSSYDNNKKPNQNKKSEIRNKKSTTSNEETPHQQSSETNNGVIPFTGLYTPDEPLSPEQVGDSPIKGLYPPREGPSPEEDSKTIPDKKSPESNDGDCPVTALYPPREGHSLEKDYEAIPDKISPESNDGDSPAKGLYPPREGPSPEKDYEAIPDKISPESNDGNCPVTGLYPPKEEPSPEKDYEAIPDKKSPESNDGDDPFTGPPAAEEVSPPSNLPLYLQILRNVFSRSGPSENGEFTFTFEELCYLVTDPDFCSIYPDQAAQMRSILQNIEIS